MKRRRSDTSGLEDVERSLHTSFCAAANSVSQLYTQAHQQHKIAFQAGQRHSLENLCEWMQRQHQFGATPTTPDIVNYLKNELDALSLAEIAIVQAQHIPLPSQSQQQVPLTPFERVVLPPDQEKFPLPSGFPAAFSTGCQY